MKIFATSDIHGNIKLVDLMIEEIVKKEQIDALIMAGDTAPKSFGPSYTFSEVKLEQKRGVIEICGLLQRTKIPVFMLIGNDDHISDEDWDKILKKHNIFNLNMTSYPLGGLKVVGFQYVLPTPWNTNNELSENKLRLKLRLIEKQVDRKTILVTHAPPLKVLDRCLNGLHVGSGSIYKLVEKKKPLFHVFGHIHESFGQEKIGNTICCNVSSLWFDGVLRGCLIDTSSRSVGNNLLHLTPGLRHDMIITGGG